MVITDGTREASSVSGEDDNSYCGALLKDAINKNDDETFLQSRPFSTDPCSTMEPWVFDIVQLCVTRIEACSPGKIIELYWK